MYVKHTSCAIPCAIFCKQFPSLVQLRGKNYFKNCNEILTIHSAVPIIWPTQIYLHTCLYEYQTICAQGSNPGPAECMKVRFKSKVTKSYLFIATLHGSFFGWHLVSSIISWQSANTPTVQHRVWWTVNGITVDSSYTGLLIVNCVFLSKVIVEYSIVWLISQIKFKKINF